MTEATKSTEKIKHENIYAALSAFQGELRPMAKTGEVEFATAGGQKVNFKYTPLGEIMATIYPLLAKHGLAVRHEIVEKGVEAILTHETYKKGNAVGMEEKQLQPTEHTVSTNYIREIDNELRSGLVRISSGGKMKDTGAEITYARRYTLTMLLGISSEDDKDAELLAESAQNAVKFAHGRARKGLEDAKTVKDLDRALSTLQRDLEALEKGKAPALGLTKEQYNELIDFGESLKIKIVNPSNSNGGIDPLKPNEA
jgi:hypothetical protein